MKTLFCFGMGYCAAALARQLAAAGDWRIVGTSRTLVSAQALQAGGVEAIVFDGNAVSAKLAAAIDAASHVLVSAPPGDCGDPVLAACPAQLTEARNVAWIGYLSTIGVYGDSGGAWLDENSPARPSHARGLRRLEAERAWLDFGACTGKRVEVFRLAGIYGPGRNVLDDLKNGTARHIDKPGQVFNRVHVADVANCLRAAIDKGKSGRIYNVTDNEPASTGDVLRYAAKLLGVAPPMPVPFNPTNLSPMLASFYAGNRRVRNERIRDELGVVLDFPTYREGLAGLLGDLEPETKP